MNNKLITLALIVLLLLMPFSFANAGEYVDTPAGWKLFDPPTVSASWGRDNSGRISTGHGTGPVRFETWSTYRHWDHEYVGGTIEVINPLWFTDAQDDLKCLFTAVRLTVSADPDTDEIGGETGLLVGLASPKVENTTGWGWVGLDLTKITNGQWSFELEAQGWFYCETWLHLGGSFNVGDIEGPGVTSTLGVEIRLNITKCTAFIIGADWIVGDYENSDRLPDLGLDEALGTSFDNQLTGARLQWFLALEWRG